MISNVHIWNVTCGDDEEDLWVTSYIKVWNDCTTQTSLANKVILCTFLFKRKHQYPQENRSWYCRLSLNAADDCNDPGIPPGAQRSAGRFHIGEKAVYLCQAGLDLLGSAERVCLVNREWSGSTPRCQGAEWQFYTHNKSTVVITVLDVGVFPLKQQSIYFEDQDLQQLGIKAVPGQYTACCYDKTSGYHCVLLQEWIPMTPPVMWQRPCQDHLQQSWMYSHQTPKRKVCITYEHTHVMTNDSTIRRASSWKWLQ